MSDKRLLVALSFYEGDKASALRLARFLADVEPEFTDVFDLLLLPRWDSSGDEATEEHCRRKFNVHTAKSTIQKTGYPAGTFSTWRGCYDWAAARRDRYEAVFTIEGDSAPLTVGWARVILSEWLKRPSVGVMGDLQPSQPRWGPHVNGNAVFSLRPEVAEKIQRFEPPSDSSPWDLRGFPIWSQFGVHDTATIKSDFRSRKLTPAYLDKLVVEGVVWHHGCKDGSADAWALGRLLPRKTRAPEASANLFVCPDTVPSVFEQGLRGHRVEASSFSDPKAFNFNPSIANFAGSVGLFYRSQKPDGISSIRFGRLADDKRSLVSDVSVEGLPKWGGGAQDHHEDPRFVELSDGPHLSFIHGRYEAGKPLSWQQCLAPLRWSGEEVSVGLPVRLKHKGNTGRTGSFEKNWVFFAEGGADFFIYKADPHEVVGLSSARVEMSAINPLAAWKARWGNPRGGTSPVRVGDRWFSFFHSSVPHLGRRRRYHMGVYSFAASAGRHTPLAVSKKPLLTASARDGFTWSPGEKLWEPIVVFPSGAVFEDGVWTISAGVNDCQCALFSLTHGEVLAALS